MKVLCFCRWLEKKIMVSTDDLVSQYTHYGRFKKELMLFHRLDSEYFNSNSLIQYECSVLNKLTLSQSKKE